MFRIKLKLTKKIDQDSQNYPHKHWQYSCKMFSLALVSKTGEFEFMSSNATKRPEINHETSNRFYFVLKTGQV